MTSKSERDDRAELWRWTAAVVRETLRPRRLGGPRPERLAMLRRGETPETEDEDAR